MDKQYKAIFFDWDHTLWDHEANAFDTLNELFIEYHLQEKYQVVFSDFYKNYQELNNELWREYQLGELTQEELRHIRFKLIFKNFDILEDSITFSDQFLYRNPRKKKLIDGAANLIKELSKHYSLYILTNGFHDIQEIKIKESGLSNYFKDCFTSDKTGYKKPQKEFFYAVLENLSLKSEEVLMVGDNPEVDINGALKSGIDAILFTNQLEYQGNSPYVQELKDLIPLLIK